MPAGQSRTGVAALTDVDAFPLVVETHRRFATALGGSIAYGLPTSDPAVTGPLNDEILREFGTVLRDSLLAAGRALVEFYTAPRTPGRTLDTDVLIVDFRGLSQPSNASQLHQTFLRGIEAHLLHITAWADFNYRTTNNPGHRQWIPWDQQTCAFGRMIFDALNEIACTPGDWSQPFQDLHAACVARRDDPTAHWPIELSGPAEISIYLSNLASGPV